MLRAVAIAGLWLVLSAALVESLWLEPTNALVLKKLDCRESNDHDFRAKGCAAIIQRNSIDVASYRRAHLDLLPRDRSRTAYPPIPMPRALQQTLL